jgi:hypothetical protein
MNPRSTVTSQPPRCSFPPYPSLRAYAWMVRLWGKTIYAIGTRVTKTASLGADKLLGTCRVV